MSQKTYAFSSYLPKKTDALALYWHRSYLPILQRLCALQHSVASRELTNEILLLRAEKCPKKPTSLTALLLKKPTLWHCVYIEVTYPSGCDVLLATQCNWRPICMIWIVLRRADWSAGMRCGCILTSRYKDAKISLGDRLITFQGVQCSIQSLGFSMLRDHLITFKVNTFAPCMCLPPSMIPIRWSHVHLTHLIIQRQIIPPSPGPHEYIAYTRPAVNDKCLTWWLKYVLIISYVRCAMFL